MKVLILGLGSIGVQHAEALWRRDPNFSIGALRSSKSGSKNLERVHNLYSWDEAREWKPDWIWITNPTSEHLSTLRRASNLSRYIFMEKPLSSVSAEVREMKSLVEQKNLRLYYGTILRCHPMLEKAQSILQSNELGPALSYQIFAGSYLPDWRPGTDYRTCYSAQKALGGGVSIDLIHEYDYAEYLFGPVAKMQGYKSHISTLEIDTDDICESLQWHETGIVGHIHLDYFRREVKRTFEVCCEKGTLSGNLVTGEMTVKRLGESEICNAYEVSREELFDRQLSKVMHFFRDESVGMRDISSSCDLLSKVIDLEFV